MIFRVFRAFRGWTCFWIENEIPRRRGAASEGGSRAPRRAPSATGDSLRAGCRHRCASDAGPGRVGRPFGQHVWPDGSQPPGRSFHTHQVNFAAARRFHPKMETGLVLVTQRRPRGGDQAHQQTQSREGQNAQQRCHHGAKPSTTSAMSRIQRCQNFWRLTSRSLRLRPACVSVSRASDHNPAEKPALTVQRCELRLFSRQKCPVSWQVSLAQRGFEAR